MITEAVEVSGGSCALRASVEATLECLIFIQVVAPGVLAESDGTGSMK